MQCNMGGGVQSRRGGGEKKHLEVVPAWIFGERAGGNQLFPSPPPPTTIAWLLTLGKPKLGWGRLANAHQTPRGGG